MHVRASPSFHENWRNGWGVLEQALGTISYNDMVVVTTPSQINARAAFWSVLGLGNHEKPFLEIRNGLICSKRAFSIDFVYCMGQTNETMHPLIKTGLITSSNPERLFISD